MASTTDKYNAEGGNSRNATRVKTALTDFGPTEATVPRRGSNLRYQSGRPQRRGHMTLAGAVLVAVVAAAVPARHATRAPYVRLEE